jgi:SAM-dependent methyltransferase/uncharacterized iron-regulated protein
MSTFTGKSVLQGFWHRIVGARGALTGVNSAGGGTTNNDNNNGISSSNNTWAFVENENSPSINMHTYKAASNTTTITTWHQGNFAKLPNDPIQEIARHKVVFLGEVHSMPPIIALQRDIQAAMACTGLEDPPSTPSSTTGTLHVILEHFSFELQGLLDQYMANEIDFDTLVEQYHTLGEEHHDLVPYRDLLEDAKSQCAAPDYAKNHTENKDTNNQQQNQQSRRQIRLHAGFLPRKYARMLLKEGEEATWQSISSQWITPSWGNVSRSSSSSNTKRWSLQGSDVHYNVFESLLSGRSLYGTKDDNDDQNKNKPSDQFRRIFPAQVLKDEAMAFKVTQLLQEGVQYQSTPPQHLVGSVSSSTPLSDDPNYMANSSSGNDAISISRHSGSTDNDKFLIIAGNGHVLHYTGVPERVLRDNPQLTPSDVCLVISQSIHNRDSFPNVTSTEETEEDEQEDKTSSTNNNKNKNQLKTWLQSQFGQEGSNPADYIFFYEIPEDILEEWSAIEAKHETQKAYNKVGDTATIPGNLVKAAWIMHHLGYTEQDFDVVGPDAYNFQGVGNPHLHANIQKGETVLDVGSGLGIDSILASHAVGPDGHVVGIDLSEQEIKYARKRFQERGLTNTSFIVGDMENMKSCIPDNSIDVIISNGAFCLAPNKEKAFAELYRVLKPGGRISICTTTIQEDKLEAGVSWPLCMKMFIAKNALQPLCESLGFHEVLIDDSNSSMSMEIPEEVFEQSNPGRNRVHVGGEDFRHLEDFDMDRICARVCVVAKKPVVVQDGASETTFTATSSTSYLASSNTSVAGLVPPPP